MSESVDLLVGFLVLYNSIAIVRTYAYNKGR